jgi:hypothetical protein
MGVMDDASVLVLSDRLYSETVSPRKDARPDEEIQVTDIDRLKDAETIMYFLTNEQFHHFRDIEKRSTWKSSLSTRSV